MLDGFQATVSKLPGIAAPVWADVNDQIAAIRDRVNTAADEIADARSKAVGDVQATAAGAPATTPGSGGAATGLGGGAAAREKSQSQFVGLDEMAKRIQSSALGKNKDRQGDIAANTDATAKGITRLAILMEQMAERARTGKRLMI